MNLRFLAGLRQSVTVSQHFTKSLALLQASTLELRTLVRNELMQNPALEYADEQPESIDPAEPIVSSSEAEDNCDTEDHTLDTVPVTCNETEQFLLENATSRKTLQEHLLEQLHELRHLPEHGLMECIVHSLDAQGYLRCSDFNNEPLLESALTKLKCLDPIGCGSRNLRECLMVQALNILPLNDLAFSILQHDMLQDVAKHNYITIHRKLSALHSNTFLKQQDTVEAVNWIKRNLNPIPARNFMSTVQPIMHDVIVTEHSNDGTLSVSLNDDVIPRIKISNSLKELQYTNDDAVVQAYVSECLKNGRQFLSGLKDRQRTILKVAISIVTRQQEYFRTGKLIPMQLSHVSRDVGYAISTVCRCVQSKWMQTPRGIYSFQHFFTEGLATAGGKSTSSATIKDAIRDIIEKHKEIKDEQITQVLLQRGIRIARRTVTKYRTELRLHNFATRKVLNNLHQDGTLSATNKPK